MTWTFGRPRLTEPSTSATDRDVMRALVASRSSSIVYHDLRVALGDRDGGLRRSLWDLETAGLVEVLDSSTGLLCVLTDRGRAHIALDRS